MEVIFFTNEKKDISSDGILQIQWIETIKKNFNLSWKLLDTLNMIHISLLTNINNLLTFAIDWVVI